MKIAAVFNFASHYRLHIYQKLEKDLSVDFYFGTIRDQSIKKINYGNLNRFKKEFRTLHWKTFSWHVGSVSLLFKGYRKFILTGDPQIISNWILLILGRILGVKVYLWTHGLYGREKGLRKAIKLVYFRLSSKLFLYGDYSRTLLLKEGFDPHKLIVVYNSLDYTKQLSIRKQLKPTKAYTDYFKNTNPVLFYIGRIQNSKKLEQILDAMKILQDNGTFLNLAVVGELDYNSSFNDEIVERNLQDYVWLVGSEYDESIIAQFIYNATVCISPGNVGLTALHSLVYGTPVITHSNPLNQMPEYEAIVHEYNGALFSENDVEDLAVKISWVIDQRFKREEIYSEVDRVWNPHNQSKIFRQELIEC